MTSPPFVSVPEQLADVSGVSLQNFPVNIWAATSAIARRQQSVRPASPPLCRTSLHTPYIVNRCVAATCAHVRLRVRSLVPQFQNFGRILRKLPVKLRL